MIPPIKNVQRHYDQKFNTKNGTLNIGTQVAECSSICNLPSLKTEFRNGVGSVPVGGNRLGIGEWI